jgi:hypothetical protein
MEVSTCRRTDSAGYLSGVSVNAMRWSDRHRNRIGDHKWEFRDHIERRQSVPMTTRQVSRTRRAK